MSTFTLVPMGFFDAVGGLPAHPLVVHLAVVMLPLSALSLMDIIIVPAWRASHGWLTMTGLCVGALGAVLAAQTGEEIAQTAGSASGLRTVASRGLHSGSPSLLSVGGEFL